jgi:DNA-binding response OmpR family regulator
MRVLLIEDDSATAQSIQLMLKSESFNVYTTDLGEEGIDLGKLYEYDIVLLDLNLPDMSGFEVLRSLRVSKVKTPILILSGFSGIEDKVKGLGFGADDYMTKPFHKTNWSRASTRSCAVHRAMPSRSSRRAISSSTLTRRPSRSAVPAYISPARSTGCWSS